MDHSPEEPKQVQDHDEMDAEDLRSQVLLGTLQELKFKDKDVECCIICLDAITEPCELNPCRHSNFDYACLLSWLLQNPKCPLCKADAVEVYHGPEHARVTTPINPTKKPARSPRRRQPPPSLFRSVRSRVQFHAARPPRASPHRRWERDDMLLEAAIQRRALIYAYGRFSKHVGTNGISRFRDFTPAMFNSDPALVSRARMWMRRELQVFPFLSRNDEPPRSSPPSAALSRPPQLQPLHHHHGRGNSIERLREHNAEYLLEFIVAMLKTVDIKGSAGQAEDMLADYLGRDNAQLFLHELASWLRSPCNRLQDWDRMVQYDPIPQTIGGPATAFRSNSNYRRERGSARRVSFTDRDEEVRRGRPVPPQDAPSARFWPGQRREERRRRPDFDPPAINNVMDLPRHRRRGTSC